MQKEKKHFRANDLKLKWLDRRDLQASTVLLRRMLVVFFVLTNPTSIKANPHCMAFAISNF